MTDVAIRCEGLAKQYRIGERESYKALRDVITDAFASPFRRLRSALRHSSNGSVGSEKPNIWALKDVSFEIKCGEVVGIIGRNGAGKSTLLKILSRITEPTHGHADIWGRVGSLLEVGSGFHPELTGRDNIFLNGAILGMKKAEIARKFDEIVAFAELEKFIDTPVKRYSSGMYMRLAFSVAAHLEPEILFVDEVLAVGDAAFQKKCLGKMGSVSRQGRTIVFVSHNMTALQKLCTRVVWLNGGQVIDTGDPRRVIDHYLQTNAVANLESVWEDNLTAPGNERVRLRSVRVRPQTEFGEPITVHTPLRIEFIYRNHVPGTVLNVSMLLYNMEEVCVFNTASDFAPRPAGLIRHTVEIPGNFLNAGCYYVNMLIVKEASTGILFQNNVVAFEVVEGEVAGNWYGRFPGVVRPKLKWKSEAIDAGDLAGSMARAQNF
jgi:homopolymeric O-antigen transport system ATP-binding protein